MKFRIAHCFKQGSIVKYKGAFLIVDYDDYVIKLAFKTIDTLNIKKHNGYRYTKLSDVLQGY